MANALEESKDYGRVPGTNKPTLFKPGAEKLLMVFALAAVKPCVEDLSHDDTIRFRVDVPIENNEGRTLSVGIGSCSSDEEKYRWRKPVCDEEFSEAPAHLKREVWKHGTGGKAYKAKQIRTSPADLENTILKMAHKRALIAATLLATGASSVFNQDLEHFGREVREAIIEADANETKAPARQVRRTEGANRRPAPPSDLIVTPPAQVNAVRQQRDSRGEVWILTLIDDSKEYRTRNAAHAEELKKFVGTEHKVRLSFKSQDWQGTTFHNIENFAIADAQAPGAAADDEPPHTDDDNTGR